MNASPPDTSSGIAAVDGWGDSPKAAFAVRAAVFVAPLVVAFAATWMLSGWWPASDDMAVALIRFIVLSVAAMSIGFATEKVARRFLPLAALLRLSLVFPDEAPSRFMIALRSGSTRSLEKRLAELESVDFAGSEAEAAKIIVELAAALGRHDRLTRGHSERVRAYTALIADEMGLTPEDSNRLQWAGLIHDVGKLKIPYEILTKPGKLTDREFATVKTHPTEGMYLAAPLADFLGPWIDAVGDHHERFEGGGYPRGIRGEEISLGGRIVAVADAYDVMTAARSYKAPYSAKYARAELARCAGTQFDPAVVRAFLNVGLPTVRRSMWPLSWALQVPFLGTAVTAPVSQVVAASVLTLATATGAAAATGGLDAIQAPDSLAFVQVGDASSDDAGESTVTVVEPAGPATQVSPISATRDGSRGSVPDEGSTTTISVQKTSSTTNTTSVVAPTAAPSSTAPPTTSSTLVTTTTVATSPVDTTTTDVATTSPPAPTTTTTMSPEASTTTTTTELVQPLNDCESAQSGDLELAGSDLGDCQLGAVDLSGANFDGADLRGATFENTTLDNASFVGARLDGAQLSGVSMRGANLEDARLRDAMLQFVDLFDSNLEDADFRRAVLIESSIKYADAEDADFRDTWIENLWLYGTSLEETNFTGAQGVPAGFESAIYDDTICPDGDEVEQVCW